MRIYTCPLIEASLRRLGALLSFAAWLTVCAADGGAHGIAGNRLFVGTLTFDDPAVTNELALTFSSLRTSEDGGSAVERRLDGTFSRLLLPWLSFSVDAAWAHRAGRGVPSVSGFDTPALGLKAQLLQDDEHETLVAAGFAWGLPGVGARRIGAHGFVEPGIFFGKGFGDLPDSLAALRPLAISGALGYEHPTGNSGGPGVLRWGASAQFSPFYLSDRFTGGLPAEEPLPQWVPLVEFSGETPRTGKTGIIVAPGIAYVSEQYQISAAAMLPLNRAAGLSPGFIVKLIVFTDEAFPSAFAKPVFSR